MPNTGLTRDALERSAQRGVKGKEPQAPFVESRLLLDTASPAHKDASLRGATTGGPGSTLVGTTRDRAGGIRRDCAG